MERREEEGGRGGGGRGKGSRVEGTWSEIHARKVMLAIHMCACADMHECVCPLSSHPSLLLFPLPPPPPPPPPQSSSPLTASRSVWTLPSSAVPVTREQFTSLPSRTRA